MINTLNSKQFGCGPNSLFIQCMSISISRQFCHILHGISKRNSVFIIMPPPPHLDSYREHHLLLEHEKMQNYKNYGQKDFSFSIFPKPWTMIIFFLSDPAVYGRIQRRSQGGGKGGTAPQRKLQSSQVVQFQARMSQRKKSRTNFRYFGGEFSK